MRRSEEIQKLIDRVVLNEQVRAVKQNLSKEELKENEAYLENPKLYEQIKDSYDNNDEYKPRIEAQVEKNKAVLEEKLDPSPEVKEDNILMLRALKSMYIDATKKEKTKEYKKVCSALVKLEHLSYANEVQDYVEKYCGGKVAGEDEIRQKNKKVYDAVKFIQKNRQGPMLNVKIRENTSLSLKELEMALVEVQDIDNYDIIQRVKQAKKSDNIIEYKDMIADLKSKYEPKDEKYTDNDKYIMQYSKELQGKNYGNKSVSYEGQATAMIVGRPNIFQRIANTVKGIFNRKSLTAVEFETSEDYSEENSITVDARRSAVSPKVEIDNSKANEAAENKNAGNSINFERIHDFQ